MPLVQLVSSKALAAGGRTLHHHQDAAIPMSAHKSNQSWPEPVSTEGQMRKLRQDWRGVNSFQAD
eukprot:149357-Prorocentrum_lima.AAC.1